MKRILTAALAIVLFAGASQAQTTDEGQGRHGKRGNAMKELQLTEEQKGKLKAIREAEKKEMQNLKADGKTDADKAARKKMHEKYRAQIEAVLTPEQKAELQESRKEMRGDRGGKGPRGSAGRMGEFGKDLNLTEDQQTKVTALNTEFKSKTETLRGNTALTDEQKKTQFRQLADEHQTKLKALLTQEQVAKLEAKRKGRKGKHRSENL